MTAEQAKIVMREVEGILRSHGVWYTKSLEYKEHLAMIRLSDITIKVDPPRQ